MNPMKEDILVPVSNHQTVKEPFKVSQNYPNPAKDLTTISVNTLTTGSLSLEVASITGQVVLHQDRGSCEAGNYFLQIDTRHMAPGIYFYTVTCNNEQVTRKMIVE